MHNKCPGSSRSPLPISMLAVAALTLFAALPVEAGSSNDPFGPRSIQSGSLRIAAANETSASAIEKMTKQDFDRLVKRLTKTKALGLFAKLALKGDAQKFLAELARFHGGGGNATIEEIEERYHLMVHKLLASLKKKDATLAQDIAAYRDVLWNMLADAEAFAALG